MALEIFCNGSNGIPMDGGFDKFTALDLPAVYLYWITKKFTDINFADDQLIVH